MVRKSKSKKSYIRRKSSPRLPLKKCRDTFGSANKKQCSVRRSRCTWNKRIGCVKLPKGKRSKYSYSHSKSKRKRSPVKSK